jgi:hypothetical protein
MADAMPSNPLHLLEDFLASLPSINAPDSLAQPETGDSASAYETHHDLSLRVAADLFGHNTSLLENSLALLEEHEQNQKEMQSQNVSNITPVIRIVRAERSGRQAILIRKQRKGKRTSIGCNGKQVENDHYLCLLGKERTDALHQVHRRGMHCTCRSFLNNIKGGGRKGSVGDATISQSIICKHLLALTLMPHLMPWSKRDADVEVLEDRVFAKLIASCQI